MTMSFRRIWIIARKELAILSGDKSLHVIAIGMPLILIAFMQPTFRVILESEGYEDVSGAEQSVPGLSVMFAFFLIGTVGLTFFREFGWGTWDRLRVSTTASAEILVGKAVPLVVLAMVQQTTLLLAGLLLFDLDITGSLFAWAAIAASLSVMLVSLGLAVFAVCQTVQQVTVVQGIATLVFAGFGGAVTPTSLFPGWIRAVAPFSPAHWAIKGYREVILDGAGLGSVADSVAALVAIAAGCACFAAVRLRFEDSKATWR